MRLGGLVSEKVYFIYSRRFLFYFWISCCVNCSNILIVVVITGKRTAVCVSSGYSFRCGMWRSWYRRWCSVTWRRCQFVTTQSWSSAWRNASLLGHSSLCNLRWPVASCCEGCKSSSSSIATVSQEIFRKLTVGFWNLRRSTSEVVMCRLYWCWT